MARESNYYIVIRPKILLNLFPRLSVPVIDSFFPMANIENYSSRTTNYLNSTIIVAPIIECLVSSREFLLTIVSKVVAPCLSLFPADSGIWWSVIFPLSGEGIFDAFGPCHPVAPHSNVSKDFTRTRFQKLTMNMYKSKDVASYLQEELTRGDHSKTVFYECNHEPSTNLTGASMDACPGDLGAKKWKRTHQVGLNILLKIFFPSFLKLLRSSILQCTSLWLWSIFFPFKRRIWVAK